MRDPPVSDLLTVVFIYLFFRRESVGKKSEMPYDRSLVKERGLRGEALSWVKKRRNLEINTNTPEHISSSCTKVVIPTLCARGGDICSATRRTPIFLIRETTDCPNDPARRACYNHCVVYGKIKRGKIRPHSHPTACDSKKPGADAPDTRR